MPRRPFELAVALPTLAAPADGFEIPSWARLAEELGFDSAWVGDHLAFRQPMLEAFVALSMAAGATSRIKLGFGVLQGGLRHPVWLAKMAGSLAVASGGRLTLGLGLGGTYPIEWQAVGVDCRARAVLLDEILSVLPPLLRGEPVDHSGAHFRFAVPGLQPAPKDEPAIWIGGVSPSALARAARHDGWLAFLTKPTTFAAAVEQLEGAAREAGRKPPAAGCALIASLDGDDKRAHRRCAEFLRHAYALPDEVATRWAIGGSSHLSDLISAYRDAGASLVQILTVEPPDEAWPYLVDMQTP